MRLNNTGIAFILPGMTQFFIAVSAIALFCSCNAGGGKGGNSVADSTGNSSLSNTAAASSIDYLKNEGDSMLIPSFQVEVALSKLADEKLVKDKETVIVAAWFAGLPKDTLSQEYAESGEMLVKYVELELSNTRTANFEGQKFSKAAYDSLADKDIHVLINVFSGRKSSPDNLIDCNILSDKMSVVKGQKFVITGKLISEADSLPH